MLDTAIYDKIAFQYDEHRGGKPRGRNFAEQRVPLLRRDERVLEIGVGTGLVAAAVQAAKFRVIGIDISREMLKQGASRVDCSVWADMNSLPFIDAYFGSVYAVWALHLAKSVPAVLREIRRVLLTGGCFLNCSGADIAKPELKPDADEAEKLVISMLDRLAGNQLFADGPAQLQEHAESAGFEFERVVDIPHEYQTSPASIALQLERRVYAVLQTASEQEIGEIVKPTIEALRSLPEKKLLRRRVRHVAVLRAV